jgi:hypothetical protein
MAVHPRVHTRGTEPNVALVRVLVHAPFSARAPWIEAELAHRSIVTQIGFSVSQVVSALVEDPPPRPQILVIDFDELTPGDIMHLHVLREQGWFGRIIALGNVPPSLRTSLVIERVLSAPLANNSLRDAVSSNGFIAATVEIPVL